MDGNKIDDISDDVYIIDTLANVLERFSFDQIFGFLREIGSQDCRIQIRKYTLKNFGSTTDEFLSGFVQYIKIIFI